MSGLQAQSEDTINGLDVREQGNALRVASNTPHLVSLGTNRLSTAVTLHPIKQGRVSIGSDPTCDVYVAGAGVCSVHCRVENSHGAVTLYPVAGRTLVDNASVVTPQRLSQGSMITLGQCNYLRFNHPEEAKLMKSVLPTGNTHAHAQKHAGFMNHHSERYQTNIQEIYKENTLSQLDQELDMTLKEMSRKKPPVAPRKPYRDIESDSDSERPKVNSIMAKVSKFEYYAKQQKSGKSQFYTSDNEISPKVFSSNSLTVNTPARDVLGGRNIPNYMVKTDQKMILLNENNAIDPKNCSYANVAIKNKNKIDDIVRNFDENSRNDYKLPKKINNDQAKDVYGKINVDKSNLDARNNKKVIDSDIYGKIGDRNVNVNPQVTFDRSVQYQSGLNGFSSQFDRNFEAEAMRMKAYQDRIKEEEQKEAETARLEEILNMCAEYEKQISSGLPITPTEKRPHNKIITNGSLPRSVALNNPNFVQTSEGYYNSPPSPVWVRFDTSQTRNYSMSQSLPTHRNLSNYENFDFSQSSLEHTPEVTNQSIENLGRMDEIGIPVFDERNELSSPIMLRKLAQEKSASPIGSPYENLYYNRNLKPKSPNTQSPRTRIKTTFAHKNLPSPQYFIFPTPPPIEKKPNFSSPINNDARTPDFAQSPIDFKKENGHNGHSSALEVKEIRFAGIEKQLSLEEEIPMIDDADVSNDIECRRANTDKNDEVKDLPSPKLKENTEEIVNNTPEVVKRERLSKNQSFDDVKKELMADIPELEEFEQDLKENKREKILKTISDDIKKMDIERDSLDSAVIDDNGEELKSKYESLKEERKKLLSQIHEIKCKMSEIRSQEDDILRELEMEKALIKGEYDSEIAILNIEQKKRTDLIDKAKKIEEEIKRLKEKQESRQNEMRDRVEIATLKVERIQEDLNDHSATEEELQNAQDILDNESKTYEDLEFQHLEEESELLANREDLQNEITHLTKKIDAQKTRILTLKSEANENLTSALDETKILQAEYVRLLNEVEGLTVQVQNVEKELKPVLTKLNHIERTQSPDSAFYTDQTRAKSGEFGYSPQSSDSDDLDLKVASFEDHSKQIKDKLKSIDQMSQSMIVDIERRVMEDGKNDLKSSTSKEKKGFWERNFDSLKRKSKDKKPKSPEKVDIMSQSLNENMFFNNETIENDVSFDKFNSLRHSKSKKKDNGPIKSNSSSKIPTFAALGKIIKKDSFGKRSRENSLKSDSDSETNGVKNRYVKNSKPTPIDNKYVKAKSLSPEKTAEQVIREETHEELDKENLTKAFDSKQDPKVHRKSCGDEPNVRNSLSEFKKIGDSGKIPSQDDIDRISKVTIDAPILPSEADMNSLGKKTLDSLMEIERKRFEMLEEQGCQMIENEREKISELKRRAQDETKKLWDLKYKEQTKSIDSDKFGGHFERGGDSYVDDSYLNNSNIFDESSGFMSSSIEELQVRNSRTESTTEDDKRSDDSRPLSHASDFSRDNILSISGAPRRSRRGVAPYTESQRPLTRYLPVERDDFDLRRHVESAGHQIELCPYLTISPTSCRGYLHKLGAKFHTWSKRWFVFDRESKTFVYYWDKSEKKPRGGAYFQVIEEVYLDHGNTSKSPNPQTTFVVKTRQRRYYLMAPSGESARIWIDVIFTGAQGYIDFMD